MPTVTASSIGRGCSVSPVTLSTVRKPSTSENSAKVMMAARKESPRADLSRWPNDVPGSTKVYTFSTSGRPSRPVGKKISTMASIENAATSLYSMVK